MTEVQKEIELEIAYVLFIDIVGYSKLVTSEQRRLLELLNQIVRESEHFRLAEAKHRLLTVPTGDGMALVFYNTPEAPVECALEISSAASEHSELQLRMGILSCRKSLSRRDTRQRRCRSQLKSREQAAAGSSPLLSLSSPHSPWADFYCPGVLRLLRVAVLHPQSLSPLLPLLPSQRRPLFPKRASRFCRSKILAATRRTLSSLTACRTKF